MLWEAWQTRKATDRPTSEALAPMLEPVYGRDWGYVASDIDQAVQEWGSFVEGRVERRWSEYRRSVDDRNAARRKSGSKADAERISSERMEWIHREEISYHVDQVMMRISHSIADTDEMGLPTAGRAMVERKPVTGNPLVDLDWDTPDVERGWL